MSQGVDVGEVQERDNVLYVRISTMIFIWAPGSAQIELRPAVNAEGPSDDVSFAETVLAYVEANGTPFEHEAFRARCLYFLREAAAATVIVEPQEGPPEPGSPSASEAPDSAVRETTDPPTPVIGSASDRSPVAQDPAVNLLGRGRLFVFSTEELVQLLTEAAGAATRPLLEDNPEYVFPSGKVLEAIKQFLADEGTQEDLSCRKLSGTVETEVVSEMVAYMCRRQQAVLRGVDPADLDLTPEEARSLIAAFMGGRPEGDALSSAHPKLEAIIAAGEVKS